MFVNKLFNQMKLSGKWKSLYLKKHKVNSYREKISKKLGVSAGETYASAFAYSLLEKRYGKYLDSIIDKNLDKPLNSKPEKIIWWMWLQGEENAPELCKVCLKSIRKYLPDYEVKVLTSENIFEYIHVSENIKNKYQKGLISHAHFSDIARANLLSEHGGIWIDSTVLLTSNPKTLLEKPLFCFKDFSFNKDHPFAASSWFIASCKHHPIMDATVKLLNKYWDDTSLLLDYFVYHYFFNMVSKRYINLWKDVPNYPNKNPHVLQFELFDDYSESRFKEICDLSPIHKLTWKVTSENKKDFYHYIYNGETLK